MMAICYGELPFSIDDKGGEKVVGKRGSTCVAINAKGEDC